uniref:Uncharacterized protein n=1 Tax=Ixodes ricinus TaxID=34613 RepID=A0A147BQF6_IXORI
MRFIFFRSFAIASSSLFKLVYFVSSAYFLFPPTLSLYYIYIYFFFIPWSFYFLFCFASLSIALTRTKLVCCSGPGRRVPPAFSLASLCCCCRVRASVCTPRRRPLFCFGFAGASQQNRRPTASRVRRSVQRTGPPYRFVFELNVHHHHQRTTALLLRRKLPTAHAARLPRTTVVCCCAARRMPVLASRSCDVFCVV